MDCVPRGFMDWVHLGGLGSIFLSSSLTQDYIVVEDVKMTTKPKLTQALNSIL